MNSSVAELARGRLEKTLFVDSTPLLDDPAALRARAQEDGFLFLKRFLPREDVLDLRADMLDIIERRGWRQPGQDALGARMNLEALNQVPDSEMRDDIGVDKAAYDAVQKLESFHTLPHHPKLVAFYEMLFGREVLVHPRHIARLVTGHRVMVPTPPHQDFYHIQGTVDTWTCWIPLGDCPRAMGGLTVLKGSNHLGYLPFVPARGAGAIAVQLCPNETAWAEVDYEAGDILTFPSYTVHKALRCQDKELIRLSLDIRYQPADQPVEANSLKPHSEMTWEDIYPGWKSKEFQYYWKKQSLEVIPWDDHYRQSGRRIC